MGTSEEEHWPTATVGHKVPIFTIVLLPLTQSVAWHRAHGPWIVDRMVTGIYFLRR
jgi:hypothetical protein